MERLRLLIVDDTSELRALYQLAFGHYGSADFEVVGEASNGVMAVEQAAAFRPDVILLDLAMPVMGGLEALPRIKECLPEVKVIVLSAFDDDMAPAAKEAGALAYLVKGGRPDALVDTVRAIILGSKLQRS